MACPTPRRLAQAAAVASFVQAAIIAYLAFGEGHDVSYTPMDAAVFYGPAGVRTVVEESLLPTLSLGGLVTAFFVLDGAFMALSCVRSVYDYEGMLAAGAHPLQLLQYAASSTASLLAVALVMGVRAGRVLVAIATLNLLTMAAGLLAELVYATRPRSAYARLPQTGTNVRQPAQSPPAATLSHWAKYSHWGLHSLGWVAQLGAWDLMAWAFLDALRTSPSASDMPSFVYLVLAVMGAVHVYFGAAQFAVLRGVKRSSVERVNVVVGPAAKTVLAWLLYSNVMAPK